MIGNSMRWLSKWLFETHIEEIVEEKFREKVVEQYNQERTKEIRQRSVELRATLNNTSHSRPEKDKGTLQSSGGDRTRSAEPQLQKPSSAEAMKAKLKGFKQ